MPKVTIVNNKLTIQMPKYSAPLPVKCSCSGASGAADCEGDSLPETLSMDPTPFEFYRRRKIGYHRLDRGACMRSPGGSIKRGHHPCAPHFWRIRVPRR